MSPAALQTQPRLWLPPGSTGRPETLHWNHWELHHCQINAAQPLHPGRAPCTAVIPPWHQPRWDYKKGLDPSPAPPGAAQGSPGRGCIAGGGCDCSCCCLPLLQGGIPRHQGLPVLQRGFLPEGRSCKNSLQWGQTAQLDRRMLAGAGAGSGCVAEPAAFAPGLLAACWGGGYFHVTGEAIFENNNNNKTTIKTKSFQLF